MQCQRNSNSKQLTGPWTHRTGPWTHRELKGGGGGVRIKWLNHLKGTFRCDKSLRHQNDCPQYIPKGKQTPASKLAFVKNDNIDYTHLTSDVHYVLTIFRRTLVSGHVVRSCSLCCFFFLFPVCPSLHRYVHYILFVWAINTVSKYLSYDPYES